MWRPRIWVCGGSGTLSPHYPLQEHLASVGGFFVVRLAMLRRLFGLPCGLSVHWRAHCMATQTNSRNPKTVEARKENK